MSKENLVSLVSNKKKRMNELHASYLGYQYPLLFPYGEDEYRNDVSHRDMLNTRKHERII